MDCTSLNQYEEQLYSVFKTFDVDNEEALNKAAVLALCDALQLEERGAALADSLFERRTQRVTFAQFRSGLLAVLGDPPPAAPASPAAGHEPAPTPHSDDDSSGREVAPKFVVGSKKYGRRSRPPRASSAPEEPPPSPPGAAPDPARRMRCKRSASAMDARAAEPAPDLDHDSRVDCERALALCRHLRMDGIDRRLVERIFEEGPDDEITVGAFFDRLNASLTTSIAGTGDAATGIEPDEEDDAEDEEAGGALPGELVAEAWERAGVQRSRRLLAELGFDGAVLRARDLQRALDDELRALAAPPDARALLLRAALALSRLRARRAARRAADAAAERDCLRADVSESNRRARLLAQEVDENQARLEAELTARLRRAESRHAEAARTAAAELAAERERAAAARGAYEAEAARRVDGEARLREEAAAERRRARDLEARLGAVEERAAVAERERARLGVALREALEAEGSAPRVEEAAGALAVRVDELRDENVRLRDRCDELVAALEARGRPAGEPGPAGAASWRDEAGAGDEPALRDDSEDCDSLPMSPERRRSQMTSRETQTVAPAVAECGTQAGGEDEEKQRLAELVKELESSLELMRDEYERCEDYWSGKLAAEREDAAAEQRAGDERLAELLARVTDYERRFTRALPTIDETYSLELQVTSLEQEYEEFKRQSGASLEEARSELAAARAELQTLRDAAAPRPRPRPYQEELTSAVESSKTAAATTAPAPAPAPHGPLQNTDNGVGSCAGCCALWRRVCAERAGAGRAARAHGAEAGALRARLARADALAAGLARRLAAADLLVRDLYRENCMLGPAPRTL